MHKPEFALKDEMLTKKEKEKRTCRIEDFAVQADYRLKIKDNEKERQLL